MNAKGTCLFCLFSSMIIPNEMPFVAAFIHAKMGSFITSGFTAIATAGIMWDNHRGRNHTVIDIDSKINETKNELRERYRTSKEDISLHADGKLEHLTCTFFMIGQAVLKALNGGTKQSQMVLRQFGEMSKKC